MFFKESLSPFTGVVTPTARSLRDLLEIRAHHLKFLRTQPGYLGSAIGFKYHEELQGGRLTHARRLAGDQPLPAILVFVARKIPAARISVGPPPLLPRFLAGPGRLSCWTDVICGLPTEMSAAALHAAAACARLPEADVAATSDLRGGLSLCSERHAGTCAALVRGRRAPHACGLLTSDTVAGTPGTVVEQRLPRPRSLGTTDLVMPEFPLRLPTSGTFAAYRTDASYHLGAARVAPATSPRPVARRAKPGVFTLPALGSPFRPDLRSTLEGTGEDARLGPLGLEVESFSQTSGPRRGRIAACAYEWCRDASQPLADRTYDFTDYLVHRPDGAPFAHADDTGSLLVTRDGHQPLGLLWGPAGPASPRAGAQRRWAYASAIGPVLDALEVDLL